MDRLLVLWRDNGDRGAREELVRRFLPLARRLASGYTGSSQPLEDLAQVAALGLLAAIDRFEPKRGIPFGAFAVPTILGELKRHLRDHRWSMHVPRSTKELALDLARARDALAASLRRSPSLSELAEALGLSPVQVCDGFLAGACYRILSIDAPARNGEAHPESIAATRGTVDDGYDLVDAVASWRSAIQQLPADDRRLLSLRFVHELTPTEIAARIGTSQMTVSRFQRRAVGQIRELVGATP